MSSNYQRKSARHSWSKEDMEKAIQSVKQNKMGWLKASKTFNVPQATLRRHFVNIPVNLGRFKPTFDSVIEQQLVDHLLYFEQRFFRFNTTDIRKLAYEFAKKAGLLHRFDKDTQMAGWDWLKGFRERHPSISLRAPEATSATRARAFNKPQVMKFFELLEKLVTDNDILPSNMYNMGESGLSTVQKPPKILAKKGKKQVGALTSAERGRHVSIAVCANAAGNFVPPAMIIPRKNYKPEYFDGAPPGTLQLCYKSGHMVGDLFVKWIKHFVSSTSCNPTNKVILILDDHSSHKNLEALEFAKANGVILLCLPPHCTHRMQPLDVSFFGPFNAYYNREMSTWLKTHPGRTVGLYQISCIFRTAYGSAASVRNITSGFEKTGIYPLNPHIFPDHLFLPSEVTKNDIEMEMDVEGPSSSSTAQHTTERTSIGPVQRDCHDIAGSSTTQEMLNKISPFPKTVSMGKARNAKGKIRGSQIPTGTLFMDKVKVQVQIKKEKQSRNCVRARKQVKRTTFQNDSGAESVEDLTGDADNTDDSDAACLYCNDLYSESKPGERWICCNLCKRWCHTLCVGVAPRIKMFTCQLCKKIKYVNLD